MELVKILFVVLWVLSLVGGIYFNRANRDALSNFGLLWILVTLLGLTVYFGHK